MLKTFSACAAALALLAIPVGADTAEGRQATETPQEASWTCSPEGLLSVGAPLVAPDPLEGDLNFQTPLLTSGPGDPCWDACRRDWGACNRHCMDLYEVDPNAYDACMWDCDYAWDDCIAQC